MLCRVYLEEKAYRQSNNFSYILISTEMHRILWKPIEVVQEYETLTEE